MRSTHCFAQMSSLACIDEVNPETGRSAISGQTFDEIKSRYPGAKIMTWEDFIGQKEKQLVSDPVEITEESFMYYLEVLPPQNWQRGIVDGQHVDSFEVMEQLSGRVTQICCHASGKYWGWAGIAGTTLEDNVAKIKAIHGL